MKFTTRRPEDGTTRRVVRFAFTPKILGYQFDDKCEKHWVWLCLYVSLEKYNKLHAKPWYCFHIEEIGGSK
jgi:hypothetical protein